MVKGYRQPLTFFRSHFVETHPVYLFFRLRCPRNVNGQSTTKLNDSSDTRCTDNPRRVGVYSSFDVL